MVTNLLVPDRRIVVPKPPSYLKLDMAFAIGAGAKLMDKSRYRSHGTISGADWADGAHGRCLDFNPATPSYVEIPAAYTQLDFTSEDFSIIARIKVDLTASRAIFARGVDRTDGWLWRVLSTGQMDFFTSQSGPRQRSYSHTGDIATDTWATVGLTREGTSVKLYGDGVALTMDFSDTHLDPATCARTAKIGIRNDLATNPFDGKIEFLRIFGGIALPATAHLAYHNALA